VPRDSRDYLDARNKPLMALFLRRKRLLKAKKTKAGKFNLTMPSNLLTIMGRYNEHKG